MNMCSKCFGEHQRSNPESRAAAAAVEAATAGSSAATAAATAGAVTGSAVPASIASVAVPVPVPTSGTPTATVEVEDISNINKKKERKVQKNTSRCWACRKKIGLTGFQCRCDYFFCSSCRYPDDHKCDFDYQASAREQLEKNNPVVVASKLDKI